MTFLLHRGIKSVRSAHSIKKKKRSIHLYLMEKEKKRRKCWSLLEFFLTTDRKCQNRKVASKSEHVSKLEQQCDYSWGALERSSFRDCCPKIVGTSRWHVWSVLLFSVLSENTSAGSSVHTRSCEKMRMKLLYKWHQQV